MRRTITVERCDPKTSRNGDKKYHLLNSAYYIWDKDIGRTFEDNVGKAFEVEIDDSNKDFPKIREIVEECKGVPAKAEKPVQENTLKETFDKESIKAKIITLLGQL